MLSEVATLLPFLASAVVTLSPAFQSELSQAQEAVTNFKTQMAYIDQEVVDLLVHESYLEEHEQTRCEAAQSIQLRIPDAKLQACSSVPELRNILSDARVRLAGAAIERLDQIARLMAVQACVSAMRAQVALDDIKSNDHWMRLTLSERVEFQKLFDEMESSLKPEQGGSRPCDEVLLEARAEGFVELSAEGMGRLASLAATRVRWRSIEEAAEAGQAVDDAAREAGLLP